MVKICTLSEHIEDQIFNLGVNGARDSINFLRSLRDMLAGRTTKPVTVTTKFDGAPAIICGINPENGKFFVGTKGVFAGTPKLNYTDADIEKNHPSEGLQKKLKTALAFLPQLGIKTILQGDMMFTHDDLKTQAIDGQNYLTFTPNTITYAVPIDSNLAQKMLKSKMGIVFHTKYVGNSIKDLKASFNPDVYQLKPTGDVWFRDAQFLDASGTATFTQAETDILTTYLREAGVLFQRMNPRVLNQIAMNENLKIQIKTYNNSKIRSGQPFGNPRDHVNGLIKWITDKLNKDILAAKISATRLKREKEKTIILSFYKTNIEQLVAIFQMINYLLESKAMIIRKLQRVKGLGTFIRTESGFKATAPEGFVAIDHIGSAVKLVDRLEFSHANFNVAKNWSEEVVFNQECLLFESPASDSAKSMGLHYLGFGYWGSGQKATHRETPDKKRVEKLSKPVETDLSKNNKKKNLNLPLKSHGLDYLAKLHNRTGGNIGSIKSDLAALAATTEKMRTDLSRDEKNAIENYCSSGYQDINDFLRTGKNSPGGVLLNKLKLKIKTIEDKITAHQKKEPDPSSNSWEGWSYRMDDLEAEHEDLLSYLDVAGHYNLDVKKSIANLDAAIKKSKVPTDLVVYRSLNKHDQKAEVGDILQPKSYTSTSLDPSTAQEFSHTDNNDIMVIRLPKGTNALFVRPWSEMTEEYEVLLAREAKLRLIRIEKSKGRLRHIYEVVND
jgi:hypothetical protein